MAYLPIFVDVDGCSCLVVGGGPVALRRVEALLEAGADVTVISPRRTGALESLARRGKLRLLARKYAPGDVRGFALVYVAVDDPQVSLEVANDARECGVAVNVADVPELCSFISPAVVRRGALTVAVSTGGSSPAMAKRIRTRLNRAFGQEYALALEVHRAARRFLRSVEPDSARRALRMTRLAASNLPARLRRGDVEGVNRILLRHVGVGLERLGFAPGGLRVEGQTEGASS